MQMISKENIPLKVLIYIVCYNAQGHIRDVLKRINPSYRNDPNVRVLISDDCSADDTVGAALEASKDLGYTNFEIFKTNVNQGYGGIRKSVIITPAIMVLITLSCCMAMGNMPRRSWVFFLIFLKAAMT